MNRSLTKYLGVFYTSLSSPSYVFTISYSSLVSHLTIKSKVKMMRKQMLFGTKECICLLYKRFPRARFLIKKKKIVGVAEILDQLLQIPSPSRNLLFIVALKSCHLASFQAHLEKKLSFSHLANIATLQLLLTELNSRTTKSMF